MHSPVSGPPEMTLRARAVIPDGEGRVLLDRTHNPQKEGFYWFPGGGIEPGETAEEAVRRELVEEAALDTPPVDLRDHEWHPPASTPRPLLPPDVAEAVAFDLENGFRRPIQHFVCDERPV